MFVFGGMRTLLATIPHVRHLRPSPLELDIELPERTMDAPADSRVGKE